MQTVSNEDMHVPARFWLDPQEADRDAVAQAMRLCKLPFAVAAAFMPNLRVEAGFPAGTVLATDGYVIPHGLATDVGCGMAAARTSVSAQRLTRRSWRGVIPLRRVQELIAHQIPAGDGPRGTHAERQVKSLNEVWPEILPMPGFRHPVAPELAELKDGLTRAMRMAPYRLGTVGGGHHFIELLADDEDHVWVVAHSGSRGVGAAMCALYDAVAAELNERWQSWVPGRPVLQGARDARREDLAFLPAEMGDGETFLKWVAFCMAYGAENRKRLVGRAEALLLGVTKGERLRYVDTPHNYVRHEHLAGRTVVVHRRGAARVEPGTWSCVAGSAKSGSWIVEGVGSAGALFSCPQGAGRRWAAGAEWDRLTEETPLRLEGLARVAYHLRPLPAS